MKTQKIFALLAAATLGLSAIANAATSGSLASLTNGGSLTIGDKTFNNFAYHAGGLSGFDANNILVTASIEGGVYYLTFAGNISLVTSGPATADLLLNYTVTAATPNTIFMIDQFYTGSAQPPTGTFLSVDETVTAAGGGPIIANSHLEVNDLSDPFAEPGDDLLVDPAQAALDVTKDIGFGISNTNGGFITISEVRQSFHQTSVPDGGMTLVLLGAALTGIGFLRRKLSA